MIERVCDEPGESFLTSQAFLESSNQYWGRISRFDKLERLQHFREPGQKSWEAFDAGDWRQSQYLVEQERPAIAEEFASDAEAGLSSYRVRVVEFPISPYLQWEFHILRLRAEYGENIRVVSAELVATFEKNGMVPELIFMGDLAMYEICYDDTGTRTGGRKFTDPGLIRHCREDVHSLYGQGEDIREFFEREIAPLPPPLPVGKIGR
jgi:hypothetical protein